MNFFLRLIDLSCVIVLMLGMAVMSGCGDGRPKRVPVSGRVLIDGKPLERGSVQVFPQGQRMAYGSLGPGGKFTLSTFDEYDGCMIGKHPVSIIASVSNGSTIKWFAPKKYSNAATSGLEIDIPGPRDDVLINITWDGGKPFVE